VDALLSYLDDKDMSKDRPPKGVIAFFTDDERVWLSCDVMSCMHLRHMTRLYVWLLFMAHREGE